jgi:MFS family permease
MVPLYATSQLGLTPKDIGFLFTISGLSVFIMILPAGFVIDKVGRKWATVPSTGIPALAFLLIPFSESFFQFAVLLAFLGVPAGFPSAPLATSTYDVVPRRLADACRPRGTSRRSAGRRAVVKDFLADAYNPVCRFSSPRPLLALSAILLAVVGRETLDR